MELFHAAKKTLVESPTEEATSVRAALRALLPKEVYDALRIHKSFIAARDVLVAMQSNGKDIPYNISPVLLERLDNLGGVELATLLHHGTASETEAVRLGIGRLLGEVTETLTKPGKSFSLYSGHDSTVEPLLVALKLFDGKWPNYTSALIFELWEGPDRELVRIKYEDKEVYRGPLDAFKKLVANRIPSDYEKECTPRDKSAAARSGGMF